MRLVLKAREQSHPWWDWTVLLFQSRRLSESPGVVNQFSFYWCTVVLLYRISGVLLHCTNVLLAYRYIQVLYMAIVL